MLIAFTHMTIILTLVKRVGVLMLRMFRFVATCMVTVAKKIKQCGAGGLLGSKHQGHNVSSNNLVFDAIAISQVSEAQRKHYHTTYHQ